MKKRGLLILGLLCGILLPLSTQAIENGIYEVEGGHKTVVWHDNIWGDIELTVASGNLEGSYQWGTTGPSQSHSEDINARGGASDSVENGFSPNPINFEERQGPCGSGRHVPSRGEWNNLFIARCNLDKNCNARYRDEPKSGISGDLNKESDWTGTNKMVFVGIGGPGFVYENDFPNIFRERFNMMQTNYESFWTSSVRMGGVDGFVFETFVTYNPGSTYYPYSSIVLNGGHNRWRGNTNKVRCFSNYVIEPKFYHIVTFINDGEHVRSGDVESGVVIPSEVISQYDLTGRIKTGYNFSGWAISGSEDMFDIENDVVTTGMTLNAVWEIINYEIDYKLDGGINNENNVTGYTIETETITLSDPAKEGYNFSGWYLDTDTGFTNQITEITQGTTGDITLYAKWTKIETKPSGGSSGGGGRSRSSSVISNDSEKSTDSETGNKVDSSANASEGQDNTQDSSANASEGQTYTPEFQQAYEFAKGKGITTMPTIQKADMDGKLTRIAMAKMLSQYAMNVLGQKPANIVTPKFNDVSDKQNSDYDDGVTLAYQLGIMGQNMPNNNFRPNDEVTRAEFATALSRMLYNTPDGEYKSTPKYYIHHMEKLVKEGIITKDDPNMKELRGYVMIMLMRSAK